jgi:hypothetical protein
MSQQLQPLPAVNRAAVISILAGLLTVLSFCTAVAPIPLTGYVCYPAAVVLGLVALLSGVVSLGQIKKSGEDGRTYALIGVWTGSITMAAGVCAIATGILLFPKVLALIQQTTK